MQDCSLCMDCASACDAISFQLVKPSASLHKKFKIDKIEVWTYILITAAISITMSFHHGLGRSSVAQEMPWVQTAKYFETLFDFGALDSVGLFAFLYAVAITLFLVYFGMYIASKALKVEFSKAFYTLGYAFAPLFIIGGLSHLLHSFFTHTYGDIANGFIYGFSLDVAQVQNLASRKDGWLAIFDIFKYLAAFWAFLIMYKRVNLFSASKRAKTIAFFFASLLIIFYLALNLSRLYIAKSKYSGSQMHKHTSHVHQAQTKG